ncbi:MAG: glycosyltransferase family 2 protein [Dehalococcoidia bacterium]|nr:glycosyltransferase family 2 protein [Dehalococcoidia bacterium]
MTTDAATHLPAYLEALKRVAYANLDLWVVDNASVDGSPDLVAEVFPGAHILRNSRNLGFTGACNLALERIVAGDAEFVLFLNDDTEVTPGFLGPLLALADERTMVTPRTYLAGSPGLLDDAAGEFDWLRGTWRNRVLGRPERQGEQRVHSVGSANLSCLLVPTPLLRRVGFLDDNFFVYYDDTDFCRRALAAGGRLFVQPESVVYHQKGATLGGQLSPFGCYYLTRNRPYLIRKHTRSNLRYGAFLAYFLATRVTRMALWARARRFDLVRATLEGLADALAGRMGEGRGLRWRTAPSIGSPSAPAKETAKAP